MTIKTDNLDETRVDPTGPSLRNSFFTMSGSSPPKADDQGGVK